jgi:hypothetical protein
MEVNTCAKRPSAIQEEKIYFTYIYNFSGLYAV